MNATLKNTMIAIGIFAASEMLLSACVTTDTSTISQKGPVVERSVRYEPDDFATADDAVAWLEKRDEKFTLHGNNNGFPDPEVTYRQQDENGNWFTVVRGEDGKFHKPSEAAVRSSQSQSEPDNGAGQ